MVQIELGWTLQVTEHKFQSMSMDFKILPIYVIGLQTLFLWSIQYLLKWSTGDRPMQGNETPKTYTKTEKISEPA
jgi:hypothetical protein